MKFIKTQNKILNNSKKLGTETKIKYLIKTKPRKIRIKSNTK